MVIHNDFDAFRSADTFGESLGLDVYLVQPSRPYTVDILRKASPVVSIGAELLMAIGPQQASFLMASSSSPWPTACRYRLIQRRDGIQQDQT